MVDSEQRARRGEASKCTRIARGQLLSKKEKTMSRFISISEVASLFSVTERTVRNWISSGLITGYKRNNHAVFIDERSLDNIYTPIQGVR